jgi:hypothetical protein
LGVSGGIKKSFSHSVRELIADGKRTHPAEREDGRTMAAAIKETRSAGTCPVGSLRHAEHRWPESLEVGHTDKPEPLDKVLGICIAPPVGPLGSRPPAEIVEYELVAQKRKQPQQEGAKARRIGEIRHIDVSKPEAEFPTLHEVPIIERLPSAQPVVYPRRRKRIVGIEADRDLDFLPAPSAYVDVDRSLGERTGAARPDAVAHMRQHLGEGGAVGPETLEALLTQRRAGWAEHAQ